MKHKILISTFMLVSSCSTLNDSILLGGTIGGITGAAATSAAYERTGKNLSNDELLTNASLGLALGVFTAYFIHKDIEEKRGELYKSAPEIYFGDLPPSPFIMTPPLKKKGGK